jgi:undecaprenyl-diphosphatase
MWNFINHYDHQFYDWIRKQPLSPALRNFLRAYTRLGDGYVWLGVIAVVYFWIGLHGLFALLKQSLFAGALSILVYWVFKLSFRRPRPFNHIQGVQAEVPPMDKYSFPSGHVMNNLAAGYVVFNALPEVGWIVLLMPITWGFLRILFGVHWLSDILAGIILGPLCGYIALTVYLHF